MIKVTITGPAREGRFPYRIDTEGTRLAGPITGLSAVPIWDACKRLQDMGAADTLAEIGLYESMGDPSQLRYSTTIGFGAQRPVAETPTGPKLTSETEKNVLPSAEMTARSVEPQPRPRKSPAHQAEADRAHSGPDKPSKSRPKRKPAGSGGRQGRR